MTTDSDLAIVTAVFRLQKEGAVVRALQDLSPFPGFSLIEVRGQGGGRGAGGEYAATEYDFSYHGHLKLQMVCRAVAAADICRMIAQAAWTGQRGDGVVYTAPIASFDHIREFGGSHPAARFSGDFVTHLQPDRSN